MIFGFNFKPYAERFKGILCYIQIKTSILLTTRQNIFETGIVPDGWLHTEFDNSGNEEAIMELRRQIEKNTKYVKWGAYAYFHDRLKRQKTLFNYKSENIWAVKKLSSENKGSGGIPICSVCGEHLSNAKFCGKCGTETQT